MGRARLDVVTKPCRSWRLARAALYLLTLAAIGGLYLAMVSQRAGPELEPYTSPALDKDGHRLSLLVPSGWGPRFPILHSVQSSACTGLNELQLVPGLSIWNHGWLGLLPLNHNDSRILHLLWVSTDDMQISLSESARYSAQACVYVTGKGTWAVVYCGSSQSDVSRTFPIIRDSVRVR